MPELPDVGYFKERFDRSALDKTIETVHFSQADKVIEASDSTLRRHLKGAQFDSTRRHGKWLFARASDEGWLVLHFGMTGDLAFFDDADAEPDHTKMRIDFGDGSHMAYVNIRKLGRLGWVDDVDEFIAEKELGPDALEIDRETFIERVGARSGTIKSTLMNQSVIAGVGNVYADEVLFQAKVHPEERVGELDEDDLSQIYEKLQHSLEIVGRHIPDLDELRGSYLVAHRGGEDTKCPKCGGSIEETEVSGRKTYFCPACQQK